MTGYTNPRHELRYFMQTVMTFLAASLRRTVRLLPMLWALATAAAEVPEAIASARYLEMDFLSQAGSCGGLDEHAACVRFGVLTARFSEPVSLINPADADFTRHAIAGVAASDGSVWRVHSVIEATPKSIAVLVVPEHVPDYSNVTSLIFEMQIASSALLDEAGHQVSAVEARTQPACCGASSAINLNFGSMSLQQVGNAIALGRLLYGARTASEGLIRLEENGAGLLPGAFTRMALAERMALVELALPIIGSESDRSWYFEFIDATLVHAVVAASVRQAKSPGDVSAALRYLSDESAYQALDGRGRSEAAAALYGIRDAPLKSALERASTFAGVNACIREGATTEQLLGKLRSALMDKQMDKRAFKGIAAVVAHSGKARDASYPKLAQFEAALHAATLGHELRCRDGSTYYKDGVCRIDGP